MKSRYSSVLSTVVFGAASALLLAQGARANAEDGDWDRPARKIVGSWTFEITQRNCETGEALGKPFLSMLTFGEGGTVLETTSNPMFFPAVRGPGHGAWTHVGGHTFKAITTAFITLDGELVKTQTIRQTIDVSEDSLTTPAATVEFIPVDGGPTMKGCATATGKRIE